MTSSGKPTLFLCSIKRVKKVENHISARIWSAQHPRAGRKKQQSSIQISTLNQIRSQKLLKSGHKIAKFPTKHAQNLKKKKNRKRKYFCLFSREKLTGKHNLDRISKNKREDKLTLWLFLFFLFVYFFFVYNGNLNSKLVRYWTGPK